MAAMEERTLGPKSACIWRGAESEQARGDLLWGVHGSSLTRHRSEKASLPALSAVAGEKAEQSLVSILPPLISGASSSAHHFQAEVRLWRGCLGLARVHRALGVLSRSHGKASSLQYAKGWGPSQPCRPAALRAQESSLVSDISSVLSGYLLTGPTSSPCVTVLLRKCPEGFLCLAPTPRHVLTAVFCSSDTSTAALTLQHRTHPCVMNHCFSKARAVQGNATRHKWNSVEGEMGSGNKFHQEPQH